MAADARNNQQYRLSNVVKSRQTLFVNDQNSVKGWIGFFLILMDLFLIYH